MKEEVTVFTDQQQNRPLYKINADRVIDWSARYHFTDLNRMELGSVKREGMRSLWKAHYQIYDGPNPSMTIREANPFTKVMDGLFGEIPVLGMFSGYLFHPQYNVTNNHDGRVVMQLRKQPSLFESKFIIEKENGLQDKQESTVLLSLLMMLLLERNRG